MRAARKGTTGSITHGASLQTTQPQNHIPSCASILRAHMCVQTCMEARGCAQAAAISLAPPQASSTLPWQVETPADLSVKCAPQAHLSEHVGLTGGERRKSFSGLRGYSPGPLLPSPRRNMCACVFCLHACVHITCVPTALRGRKREMPWNRSYRQLWATSLQSCNNASKATKM